VVLAFAVGAIPWGLMLARWVAGVDVRTVGSGNVGATNVARVLGKKWFPVVFVLDAAKGAVPVLFFAKLAGQPESDWLPAACGLAAVLGHIFNPFLRFKGGKGVATAAGVLATLAPLPGLVALLSFLLVFALFRYVSLGSIAAALAVVPAALVVGSKPAVTGFCALAAAVVLVRHRGNMARIAAGTEPRVGARKEPSGG
jgi:glycerol-3-phosphate acyltransferase PlsY